jgi:hypothetical protein
VIANPRQSVLGAFFKNKNPPCLRSELRCIEEFLV